MFPDKGRASSIMKSSFLQTNNGQRFSWKLSCFPPSNHLQILSVNSLWDHFESWSILSPPEGSTSNIYLCGIQWDCKFSSQYPRLLIQGYVHGLVSRIILQADDITSGLISTSQHVPLAWLATGIQRNDKHCFYLSPFSQTMKFPYVLTTRARGGIPEFVRQKRNGFEIRF